MNSNNFSKNSSNFEKCKKILMDKPMMPMMPIKNIIIGSVATVIPWFVLLIIVGFIIIV